MLTRNLKRIFIRLKAGVIMAGNIPLAGFHDFLSVLISGNSIIAKTSSKDSDTHCQNPVKSSVP